jgi:hypothetical protein
LTYAKQEYHAIKKALKGLGLRLRGGSVQNPSDDTWILSRFMQLSIHIYGIENQ